MGHVYERMIVSRQAIADRNKTHLSGNYCRGPCETAKEAAADAAHTQA